MAVLPEQTESCRIRGNQRLQRQNRSADFEGENTNESRYHAEFIRIRVAPLILFREYMIYKRQLESGDLAAIKK
jgi:hypothetical protein